MLVTLIQNQDHLHTAHESVARKSNEIEFKHEQPPCDHTMFQRRQTNFRNFQSEGQIAIVNKKNLIIVVTEKMLSILKSYYEIYLCEVNKFDSYSARFQFFPFFSLFLIGPTCVCVLVSQCESWLHWPHDIYIYIEHTHSHTAHHTSPIKHFSECLIAEIISQNDREIVSWEMVVVTGACVRDSYILCVCTSTHQRTGSSMMVYGFHVCSDSLINC